MMVISTPVNAHLGNHRRRNTFPRRTQTLPLKRRANDVPIGQREHYFGSGLAARRDAGVGWGD
jgi:hypothetical protein